MSKHKQEEQSVRDSGRFPVAPHCDQKSVGTHTTVKNENDPTVASVDDESYSGSGGAAGGSTLD